MQLVSFPHYMRFKFRDWNWTKWSQSQITISLNVCYRSVGPVDVSCPRRAVTYSATTASHRPSPPWSAAPTVGKNWLRRQAYMKYTFEWFHEISFVAFVFFVISPFLQSSFPCVYILYPAISLINSITHFVITNTGMFHNCTHHLYRTAVADFLLTS